MRWDWVEITLLIVIALYLFVIGFIVLWAIIHDDRIERPRAMPSTDPQETVEPKH